MLTIIPSAAGLAWNEQGSRRYPPEANRPIIKVLQLVVEEL
jgi:hypothetical protein